MIFDAWVNANPPEWRAGFSPIHEEALNRLFDAHHEALRGVDWQEQLHLMDEAGVDMAMLTALPEFRPDIDDALNYMSAAVSAHPTRFMLSVGVDPRLGLRTLQNMERWAAESDVRLFHLTPYWDRVPANHAIYYPVYAKAAELQVPIAVNIGMPGPRLPGLVQQPSLLDEVLIHFPELTIVGAHMGHPWVDEVIALLVRHPNFCLMTSAWAPKHYPRQVVEYAASRGVGRVLFASDYPALSMSRCVDEARLLPLGETAADEFLGLAAQRLFGRREG